jgi:hypothetical protein
MPCHQSAETKVVIDVFVPIDVAEFASAALLHKDRVGIVSAVVAGNAQRQAPQIFLVRLRRLRRALFKRI